MYEREKIDMKIAENICIKLWTDVCVDAIFIIFLFI